MKRNFYRNQPRLDGVAAMIVLAFLGLIICCYEKDLPNGEASPKRTSAPLANRNVGSSVKLIGGIEIRP